MKKDRRGFLQQTGRLGVMSAACGMAMSANSTAAATEPDRPNPPDDKTIKKKAGPFGEGLAVTLAGYDYSRADGLVDGSVTIKGCAHQFEVTGIGPLNEHAFYGAQTRDVTELGLIPYLLAFANGNFRDYILLPIPILRQFRHKSIFVRSDRGITKPQDLRGRKVATVGYSSSGLTHVRGVLKDEYGVSPDEIEWISVSKDSAANLTGNASKWEKVRPKGIKISDAPDGEDDSSLLLSGKVDAIFHPADPKAFQDRNPKIKRLFDDHRSVEQEYFKRTGIFPVMHSVAVRVETVKKNPWLPKAVFDAYCRAKQLDYTRMRQWGWVMDALPWYGQEFDNTYSLMGPNFYPYGLKASAASYEKAIQYVFEQGLAKRRLDLKELFEPSTWDLIDTSSCLK